MKKTLYISAILFYTFNVHAQTETLEFIGTYGDWMPNGKSLITELKLQPNGTFWLRTVDYIYPQTFKDYINEGTWISNDNEVTLNPELKRREPTVSIKEKNIGLKDSIEIKINHEILLYENQELTEQKNTDFEKFTIYFDKRRKHINLLREPYIRKCGWAPRVKNQRILDSTNVFRIAKRGFKKIGVYTYGFVKPIEVTLKNPDADFLEVNVSVPVDKERMPRNKKVIIRGNKAYYYELNGKVNTSLMTPLQKRTR